MRQPGKILVADDELSIRRLFEIGLRDAGFEVVTVKNGQEALERLKKEYFDIFIVDLRMPGLDGFATTQKAQAIRPDIPIILQGSYKNEESVKKAASLGIVEYFTKPFEWPVVLKTINNILKVSQKVS
jgi:DNA-binding NtrC family response regulator